MNDTAEQIDLPLAAPKSFRFAVQDFRIGAIYMFGVRRRLEHTEVSALLVDRANMKPAAAEQLADHWFTSEPYRMGVLSNGRALWGDEGWGVHGQSEDKK